MLPISTPPRRVSSSSWACGAVLGLAGALAALACSGQSGGTETPAPVPSQGTYAGRASCLECHPDEDELWAGSHHDLAMQPADAGTVLGAFDGATFTKDGVTSTFTRSGDAFVVRTDGPDGELVDFEVAYVFGVDPLQQYLVKFPGGRMQALPLAWDARSAEDGGQRWFHLYPGERIPAGDVLHWTGPNQNWNYMCAECHSTNLRRGYDLAKGEYTTTWSELDVSCESCHGPGARHVAWAYMELEDERYGLERILKDADEGRWVIDLETGNSTRYPPRTERAELDACAPCHSRRTPLAKDAQERPFHDGHRLSLLDEGLYHPDGQIQDEVYVYGSFLQSRMYMKGVTCGDCHQPHSMKLHLKGNSLCFQCHYELKYDSPEHHFHEAGTSGASCVECHMPETTYMVVDPRRDHSLRIPRPDLTLKLGVPNACNQCHTDQSARWANEHFEKWYGPAAERPPHYGEALHAARTGEPGAGPALSALVRDAEAPPIVRATALEALGAYLDQETVGAVMSGLQDEDGLVRAAALRTIEPFPRQQRLGMAAQLLNDPLRSVRIEAVRLMAGAPLQGADERGQSLLKDAFDEFRDAQLANAERPEAHMNLGNFEADSERWPAAEAAYKTAIRIDPAFVQAYLNLADLYRSREREEDAERTLREAVAVAPDDAYVRHSLGLFLVRAGKKEQALEELSRAAASAPEVARFAYVQAVCLDDAGRTQDALIVLEDCAARHPRDRDVRMALVTYYRDSGDLAAARRHLRVLEELAPGDPGVAELGREIRDGGR